MTIETKPVQQKPGAAPQNDLAEASAWTSWIKIAFVGLGVAALITFAYLSPVRGHLVNLMQMPQQIRALGTFAPVVLMLGVALLVTVGFPRLPFCVIAGMALGFWSGLFWAQLGTLIGNYALFVLARAGFADWMQRFLSKRARFQGAIQHRGALGVLIARQLPLPGVVINVTCALLPIRHADFLIGTLVGQLPQAIPCTLIGAGVLQRSYAKSITVIGVALAASILAWFGLRYLVKRLKAGSVK